MRSVQYMAPEVAEGVPASPASDMYSLGIILYELLTGNVPYDSDTPISIALKHAKDPIPPIRAANPGVPKSFETLITKALQKEPENRFRSAKAMLNDLRSVREGLNLSKPLTWTPTTEKQAPEPIADDTDEFEEEAPAVLSILRKTLIVAVAVIGIIATAMIAYVWMNPGEAQVPDIIGKDLITAQTMASRAKVRLVVKTEEFNEKYDQGVIYYANPGAGRTIKAGKTVDVWVSKGSKYARVPRLSTLPEETARKRLMDEGLVVGDLTQEYSDTVETGSIVRQSPGPGTRLMRGDAVELVISLGPEPTEDLSTPPEASTDNTETNAQPRTFHVKFEVPVGRENQMVQITVVDDYGENVVYSDIGHPGDVIKQSVQGIGKKIAIRIYIDDKLIQELNK
jgi:serine/threonine-protein kinase